MLLSSFVRECFRRPSFGRQQHWSAAGFPSVNYPLKLWTHNWTLSRFQTNTLSVCLVDILFRINLAGCTEAEWWRCFITLIWIIHVDFHALKLLTWKKGGFNLFIYFTYKGFDWNFCVLLWSIWASAVLQRRMGKNISLSLFSFTRVRIILKGTVQTRNATDLISISVSVLVVSQSVFVHFSFFITYLNIGRYSLKSADWTNNSFVLFSCLTKLEKRLMYQKKLYLSMYMSLFKKRNVLSQFSWFSVLDRYHLIPNLWYRYMKWMVASPAGHRFPGGTRPGRLNFGLLVP